MVTRTCGFKDSKGNFYDTEYKALKADFKNSIADIIYEKTCRVADWYSIKVTLDYCIDEYNLLDRPTVPFWKKIV